MKLMNAITRCLHSASNLAIQNHFLIHTASEPDSRSVEHPGCSLGKPTQLIRIAP